MKIKNKIELSENEQRAVTAGIEIAFDSREQKDAFLLLLIKEDIPWQYDVRGNFSQGGHIVEIYELSWGANIERIGYLISKIDGSGKWDD